MTEHELEFIQQLITRCISINMIHVNKEKKATFFNQKEYGNVAGLLNDSEQIFKEYHNLCSDGTLFHIITPIHLHFCILCISKDQEEHLVLGPFLDHALSDKMVYEVIGMLHLTIEHASQLKLIYQSLPVHDATHITDIFQLVREQIFGDAYSSRIMSLDFRSLPNVQDPFAIPTEEIEKNIAYKQIEERYKLEAQMLDAISKGDVAKAQAFGKSFNSLTKSLVRTKDSIRNKKNLLFVANTLYRKAAELGGVHPFYLDEASTKWAIRVENTASIVALDEMSLQIIRSYCFLVKNHSLAQYSSIVKKAVNYIHLNIASTLTVSGVANEVGVSPDYLTRLFKKELGIPVITYINKKRIQASLKLLNTTDLSIQDIGDLVGLTDTSYFNKLFKKFIGVSPNKYRESLK